MTTFSTSCGHSTWPRPASLLLLVVALLVHASEVSAVTRGGDVEQAWSRVTQGLDPLDEAQFVDRCTDLLRIADRSELRRLTPMALALVLKARTMPPEQAGLLLRYAVRLDPRSPEAQLALAGWSLGQWSIGSALGATLGGLQALVTDHRLAPVLRPSAVLATLLGCLAALAVWAVTAVRRAAIRLWHDLMELGTRKRLGPNAPVLAIAVFLLPLLTGGDPLFLVLWIVAICWAYFSELGKLLGIALLALTAAAPPITEIAFHRLTRPPNAVLQAAAALEESRYDPYMLGEVEALADLFGDSPEFHQLTGDLHRQFGHLDAAAIAYREGLRVSTGYGSLSLALGTVHYLEGDYNAALHAFQTARAAGADPVASNYNLSLALAQTYNFRESDEALALARAADPVRFRRLTAGRDQQPVILTVSQHQIEAMLARSDPVALLRRGIIAPPLLRERSFGHPLALLSFGLLLFAVGHYLVRERLGGFASACVKCGRAFCDRCRLSQESQSYCAQCMTMVLKKDTVAIDAQLAKRKQLDRHVLFLRLERRVLDGLLPGLGLALGGRWLIGSFLALVATTAITLTVIWLPLFVAPILMGTSVAPLRLAGASVWLLAAVISQLPRTERR